MLRLIQIGNQLPIGYPVDSTSVFEPGQISQLKLMGNDIVVGVSDGTAPLGILDDVRSVAFTKPVMDEIVVIQATGIWDGYKWVSASISKQELANPQIVAASFVADYDNLILNPINGILTVPAGSTLNYDLDGDGIPDSIKTIVSYVYYIASLPGEDTTIGSGRATIWVGRGIYATDQYDTTQKYPLNAVLFVSPEGKLTTRQATPFHPAIGMVLGPPSALV